MSTNLLGLENREWPSGQPGPIVRNWVPKRTTYMSERYRESVLARRGTSRGHPCS